LFNNEAVKKFILNNDMTGIFGTINSVSMRMISNLPQQKVQIMAVPQILIPAFRELFILAGCRNISIKWNNVECNNPCRFSAIPKNATLLTACEIGINRNWINKGL
jgi:hypothetical protein